MLMSFTFFLLLSLFNFSNNLIIKISIEKGDFCLSKIYDRDDKAIISFNVNHPDPSKQFINLHMMNMNNGSIILKLDKTGLYKEKIKIDKSAEYRVCLKPIFNEEVAVNISVLSEIEISETSDIANESK